MALNEILVTPAKAEGQDALKEYLNIYIDANIIPHVISEPGDGKTSIISALFFTEHNYAVNILGNSEPQTIEGFPYIHDNYTAFAPPKWARDAINYQNTSYFKDHPIFYVFFDELAQARPDVQQSLLTPLESRILPSGDKLPDYVRFVCASNPPEYSPRGNTLIPALANRMAHIKFEPLIEEWINDFLINWGKPLSESGGRIRKTIANFAMENKSVMRTLKPSGEYTFPSLRAYTKLAEALEIFYNTNTSKVKLLPFVASFIGLKPASMLVQFLENPSLSYAEFFENYALYRPGDSILMDMYHMDNLLIDKSSEPSHIAKRIKHLYNNSHPHFKAGYRSRVENWAKNHNMKPVFDNKECVEL